MTYRLIIFIVSIIFGVVMSMPSFLQTEKGSKINLGLDLQGGLHMLLGVKTQEAIKSKIIETINIISLYVIVYLPMPLFFRFFLR